MTINKISKTSIIRGGGWRAFYEGRETSCAFGVYLESVRRDKREKLLEGKTIS
jgi:hypothetical protein